MADLPGVFVVFEGGDGAGKTTQIERVTGWLTRNGHDVLITREPGGTALGVQIRQLLLHGDHLDPRAEALLFAADRAHHVATVVRPALATGRAVVQDRYLDSSVAYQGAGRDLDPAQIRDLSLWASDGLLPDLTVLLDVDPETAAARRSGGPDRLEAESRQFHQRVRQHFLDLAAAEPQRYLTIDATLPAEQITEQIVAALSPLLAARAATARTP